MYIEHIAPKITSLVNGNYFYQSSSHTWGHYVKDNSKSKKSLEPDKGHFVRPRLVWRNGTPLASRVVHEVTDHLWSCVRNLRVFPEDARGVSAPTCCAFIHRLAFEEVSRSLVLIKSGPWNRGLSACSMALEATSRISS